ncbi:MAG: hypothetical protein QOH48_1838 [Actinomycetota bacterium]|nr:hypothetical protein [Actinomycetota bacterium]
MVRGAETKYRKAVAALLIVGGLLFAGGMVAMQALASANLHAAAANAQRVRPRQSPRYDPANFSARVDNAWFPLKPGITYIYRGSKDGKRSRDLYRVTHQVVPIDGVPCRVVQDKLYLNGVLEERTKDYYTQDEDGNVWYFAEDTAELDKNGNVLNTDGTWRTGKNGAQAGIYMQADPQVGDQFQQEFYRHHAEDHYKVLSLSAEIKVPYGHFGKNRLKHNVELTKEWTPLEPAVRDHKYYVRGIGEVKEQTVKGGHETARLVRIVSH